MNTPFASTEDPDPSVHTPPAEPAAELALPLRASNGRTLDFVACRCNRALL